MSFVTESYGDALSLEKNLVATSESEQEGEARPGKRRIKHKKLSIFETVISPPSPDPPLIPVSQNLDSSPDSMGEEIILEESDETSGYIERSQSMYLT